MSEGLAPTIGVELGELLGRGYTLPARWYTDPAILELERERIFRRAWQYAGAAELVAEPGSYFTCRAGHIPLVVARDGEGELRGFVNVCRHRGHLVAQGSGRRETLQCPYHAWTYGLDGCLRAAPRSGRERAFDKAELGLLPVSVATWGPFVFVNPDPGAAPLAETIGPLPATIAASGLDLGAVRFRTRIEWEDTVNWKIAIENYLECYHCPVAHPGFSAVIDPDAYELATDGLVSSQIGSIRDSALAGNGRPTAYDPRGEVTEGQFHLLWPNTTFNINPGRPSISVDVWIPLEAERLWSASEYFFAEDVPDDYVRDLMEFDLQVGREDVALVESVQRGLRSGTVPHGRLLMGSERLIHDFQTRLYRALSGG